MKVLVINAGSSSIKFELFDMPDERVLASGVVERIGEASGRLAWCVGTVSMTVERVVQDHAVGLRLILEALTEGECAPLADLGEVGAVATQAAQEHCPGGYRMISNSGYDGMQSQSHAHVHILGGQFLGEYA